MKFDIGGRVVLKVDKKYGSVKFNAGTLAIIHAVYKLSKMYKVKGRGQAK